MIRNIRLSLWSNIMKKTHTRIVALLGALALTALGTLGCSHGSGGDGNFGGGGGNYEVLLDGGPSGRKATTAPGSQGKITATGTPANTYNSLEEALAAAEKASGPVVITLEPGTYAATGLKYKSNNDLIIKGSSSADYGTDVLIVGQGSNMAVESTRSLLSFEGNANIVLENLTLKNSHGETTGTAQSETLGVSNKAFTGTLAVYNCSFLSGQDTICTQGKAWFYKCYIEGDVDFLWIEGQKEGEAKVALYEECIIRAIGTRSSSAYIAAPRLFKGNSVWKGVVLYNSILQAETGLKNFYLGRHPDDWGTSYYNNVAIVGCKLQLASGVTLHSDIWKGNACGTSNQQYVGFKTDEYFTKSASGSGARLTAVQVADDYAGRENILNRYYDINADRFKQDAEAYWDINALIAARGWSATLDTSSSLGAGETKVNSVVYTFSGTSENGPVTVTSSTGDTSGITLPSDFVWHDTQHGTYFNASDKTITLTLTEPSVITLKACSQNNSGTIATTGVTQKTFKGASDGESQSILYTGNGGTLTITFTGTVYLHDQIVVKTLTDEVNKVAAVSIGGAANVATSGTGTLTASCATTYLNDYTPKSYSWSCTSGATVSGNDASATITGGSSNATVTVTCTVDGVSGKKVVTVGDVTAETGKTYSYNLESAEFKEKTGTSTDGLLSWTATATQNHGVQFGTGNTMTIVVAGSVNVALTCCQHANQGKVTVTDSSGNTVATDVSVSNRTDNGGDGTCTTAKTISYTGGKATKLTFTFTNTAYIHAVTVTPAN